MDSVNLVLVLDSTVSKLHQNFAGLRLIAGKHLGHDGDLPLPAGSGRHTAYPNQQKLMVDRSKVGQASETGEAVSHCTCRHVEDIRALMERTAQP